MEFMIGQAWLSCVRWHLPCPSHAPEDSAKSRTAAAREARGRAVEPCVVPRPSAPSRGRGGNVGCNVRHTGFLIANMMLCAASYAHAQVDTSILSADRRIDWSRAGVPGGIPDRTTICAT